MSKYQYEFPQQQLAENINRCEKLMISHGAELGDIEKKINVLSKRIIQYEAALSKLSGEVVSVYLPNPYCDQGEAPEWQLFETAKGLIQELSALRKRLSTITEIRSNICSEIEQYTRAMEKLES